MEYVNAALVVGCYAIVIRLYIWVASELEKQRKAVSNVMDTVTNHRLETAVHVDVKELVRAGDCDGRFQLIQAEIAGLKQGVGEAKTEIGKVSQKIDKGFDRMADAIQRKGNS